MRQPISVDGTDLGGPLLVTCDHPATHRNEKSRTSGGYLNLTDPLEHGTKTQSAEGQRFVFARGVWNGEGGPQKAPSPFVYFRAAILV